MSKPGRKLIHTMRQEHKSGLSYRLIGLKRGRTKGSVEYWLKRKGREHRLSEWKRSMAERNERIVTLTMRGVELKKVAHLVGSNYQTVWKVARRFGVKRSTEVKQEQARNWRRRNEAGESKAEIARSLGVPATTVRAAIERLVKRESVQQ